VRVVFSVPITFG